MKPAIDSELDKLKKNILYDSFDSRSLIWPSLCVRWGQLVSADKFSQRQKLYYSERGGAQNVLISATVEINKRGFPSSDAMGKQSEGRSLKQKYPQKKIPVPENKEVNKIREIFCSRGGFVCAKTDAKALCCWHIYDLSDACMSPDKDIAPSLLLTGHSDKANETNFALATCTQEPSVLSGGKDKLILLWNMHDSSRGDKTLNPRQAFYGHTNGVEDVCFAPNCPFSFASVGDDCCLCFWDARSGPQPCGSIQNSSNADINCLDWNPFQSHYVITGSSDGVIRLYDTRKLVGPDRTVAGFGGAGIDAIYRVEWSNHSPHHFAASGESRFVYCWDIQTNQIMMKHGEHSTAVTDFHWNPHDEWTFASVSEDSSAGGGTLQIWRISDLVCKSDEQILRELNSYQRKILLQQQEQQEQQMVTSTKE